MTKVPEKALSEAEASQTLPARIRELSLKFIAGLVGAALAMIMIGISLPFCCLFVGGFYGWAIAEGIFAPPIGACVRKLGFSDIWVEKTKKAVIYVGAVFFAFGVFGYTFLN